MKKQKRRKKLKKKPMKRTRKKRSGNNHKPNGNGKSFNGNGSSQYNGISDSQYNLSKIIENFGGQYVNDLPSDYKPPHNFCDDLGLLLWKQGLKEHRIHLQFNRTDIGLGMEVGMVTFPTTYDKNPYDFVNTTFCSVSHKMMEMNENGMSYWSGNFGFGLKNQMMWLKHPNPEELTRELVMSVVFPEGRTQFMKFGNKLKSSYPRGIYGKFKVSPLIRKRNPINKMIEFYSVLILDGYDTMKDTNGFKSSMFTDEFEKNFDFEGV